MMNDEKEKADVKDEEKTFVPDDNWVSDMKADMEEYIEEQGIYIRQ